MITKEALIKNTPCLVELEWDNIRLIAMVDYHEWDGECRQCILKNLYGEHYENCLGEIYSWKVDFVLKFGTFYTDTLTLEFKNEEV